MGSNSHSLLFVVVIIVVVARSTFRHDIKINHLFFLFFWGDEKFLFLFIECKVENCPAQLLSLTVHYCQETHLHCSVRSVAARLFTPSVTRGTSDSIEMEGKCKRRSVCFCSHYYTECCHSRVYFPLKYIEAVHSIQLCAEQTMFRVIWLT